MKRKHKRLVFLMLMLAVCSISIIVIGSSLQENISFFYYPTKLLSANTEQGKTIRLGGVVVPGSIVRYQSHIEFSVTDNTSVVPVIYKKKVLPNLFKENNGIVTEGNFIDGKFVANSILAKHNERYKPSE